MKYAYVTMIYGNKSDFINGVILVALGLKKQKVKHDIICLLTKDNLVYKKDLEKIFDYIFEIPYISNIKYDKDTILISEKICKKNDSNNTFYTKLNIFNKKILNYDKIIYIDGDLIPISNFDKLFEYSTPAAWLEKNDNGKIIWGDWHFNENEIIPNIYTNQLHRASNCINAGLLVIEPNDKIYKTLIEKLQNYDKFKINHLGGFNKYGYFETNFYQYYDQSFLTHEFSGKWHYVNALYNTWGFNNFNIYGIHMAGLHRFKDNKKIDFKSWEFQMNDDNAYNYFTNLTFIYGLINFPFIKDLILKNLKISIDNENFLFNEIPEDLVEKLSVTQNFLLKILKSNNKDYLKEKDLYELFINMSSKLINNDF